MNPLVLAFLRAHRLTEADIERRDGDVRLIDWDGHKLPWTICFVQWNNARLTEYAFDVLHLTRDLETRDAWFIAQNAGYVEWLTKKY